MHTQWCQGCLKIKNLGSNSKILIARSTIQPKLSKIKKNMKKCINFHQKLANGFWFYTILAGWSTWQWVFLNFSQNFWSFDTIETSGSVSAVFAENEIRNRLKQILQVCKVIAPSQDPVNCVIYLLLMSPLWCPNYLMLS